MVDDETPEPLSKEDLAKVQGGITLDNGLKQSDVIVRKKPDGDGIFSDAWLNDAKVDPEAGR